MMMVLGWFVKGIILAYRYLISPLFPATCRFQPTCSAYALEAVRRHGVWRGGVLMVRRLLKCHPWGRWGYDPVPHSPPGNAEIVAAGHGLLRSEQERRQKKGLCHNG
jgi:putative membrane protein insertion efficiency factor